MNPTAQTRPSTPCAVTSLQRRTVGGAWRFFGQDGQGGKMGTATGGTTNDGEPFPGLRRWWDHKSSRCNGSGDERLTVGGSGLVSSHGGKWGWWRNDHRTTATASCSPVSGDGKITDPMALIDRWQWLWMTFPLATSIDGSGRWGRWWPRSVNSDPCDRDGFRFFVWRHKKKKPTLIPC